MIIEHCDKVDITRILLERADGVFMQARVSTLSLANAVLENWARTASEKGENHCHVRIVFEDGLQFLSHIVLSRAQKRISLARHVRQQLAAMRSPKNSRRGNPDAPVCITGPNGAGLQLNPEAMLARYDI